MQECLFLFQTLNLLRHRIIYGYNRVCVDSCLKNIILLLLLFNFKVGMSADSSAAHLYFHPVKDYFDKSRYHAFGLDMITFVSNI